MVDFFVNDKQVFFQEVWYHHQTDPKPGGNKYLVIISFEEKEILELIGKMINLKLSDVAFIQEAMKHNSSAYNIINYIVIELRKKIVRVETEKKWVFNNIGKIMLTDKELIVEGTASEFIENFV